MLSLLPINECDKFVTSSDMGADPEVEFILSQPPQQAVHTEPFELHHTSLAAGVDAWSPAWAKHSAPSRLHAVSPRQLISTVEPSTDEVGFASDGCPPIPNTPVPSISAFSEDIDISSTPVNTLAPCELEDSAVKCLRQSNVSRMAVDRFQQALQGMDVPLNSTRLENNIFVANALFDASQVACPVLTQNMASISNNLLQDASMDNEGKLKMLANHYTLDKKKMNYRDNRLQKARGVEAPRCLLRLRGIPTGPDHISLVLQSKYGGKKRTRKSRAISKTNEQQQQDTNDVLEKLL